MRNWQDDWRAVFVNGQGESKIRLEEVILFSSVPPDPPPAIPKGNDPYRGLSIRDDARIHALITDFISGSPRWIISISLFDSWYAGACIGFIRGREVPPFFQERIDEIVREGKMVGKKKKATREAKAKEKAAES